jgi:hypothetical protein
MLLHLFLQVKDNRLKEIISRVLLERFIVHRPHPWGALATFIELLRNPKYDFANQEFTQSSREVALLLNQVRFLLDHLISHLTYLVRSLLLSSRPRSRNLLSIVLSFLS